MQTKTKKPAAAKKVAAKKPAARKRSAKPTIDPTTRRAAARAALTRQAKAAPESLTKQQRQTLVDSGAIMGGLTGKALALFIDKGETPAVTIAAARAAKPTTREEQSERAGKLTVNAALKQALAAAPATAEELVPVVTKLRGMDTARGVVTSGLKWGVDKGWYNKNEKDGSYKLV